MADARVFCFTGRDLWACIAVPFARGFVVRCHPGHPAGIN